MTSSIKTVRTLAPRSLLARICFVIFMTALAGLYGYYISQMDAPSWDGFSYLENARNWREGTPLFEPYRPPLISWMIALIWAVTGERWQPFMWLNAAFTLAAGLVLFAALQKRKGSWFSVGVVSLTLINTTVFTVTAQLYTEGLALFFMATMLYFMWSRNPAHWYLAGVSIGLAFAARYPVLVQCFIVFGAELLTQQKARLFRNVLVGAMLVIGAVIAAVYFKTGTFATSLPKDAHFTLRLSTYYLEHALEIWGVVVLLVPLALLLRHTWQDRGNLTFIAWAFGGLAFWSANALNQKFRFTVNYTPAVYFLALLVLEWLAYKAVGRADPIGRAQLRPVLASSSRDQTPPQ